MKSTLLVLNRMWLMLKFAMALKVNDFLNLFRKFKIDKQVYAQCYNARYFLKKAMYTTKYNLAFDMTVVDQKSGNIVDVDGIFVSMKNANLQTTLFLQTYQAKLFSKYSELCKITNQELDKA